MRPGLASLLFAGVSSVFAAGSAQAVICYVVYDRSETVIYQKTYPPVDMSNAGYPAREAMRARGEHMTFGDINECPTLVFLTGTGGMSDVRVDDVVAGMPVRTIAGTSPVGALNRAASGATPGGSAPTPSAPAPLPQSRGAY